MRRLIFTFYILLWTSILHSQSFTMQIEDCFSYYHHGNKIFLTTCNLRNLTQDTLVMWISDSVCQENDDIKNINEYFFHLNEGGLTTLSQMIYDSNVSEITVEVGSTFIKELLPKTSFMFVFLDTIKHEETYYLEYLFQHVVAVKKNLLMQRKYNYPSFPTWQLLIFKKDYIVLGNTQI